MPNRKSKLLASVNYHGWMCVSPNTAKYHTPTIVHERMTDAELKMSRAELAQSLIGRFEEELKILSRLMNDLESFFNPSDLMLLRDMTVAILDKLQILAVPRKTRRSQNRRAQNQRLK